VLGGHDLVANVLRRGHLLEHLYREVRALRIYEGASEVQRTIIAPGSFTADWPPRDRGDDRVALTCRVYDGR
jgi:hypothetical protein